MGSDRSEPKRSTRNKKITRKKIKIGKGKPAARETKKTIEGMEAIKSGGC